MDFLQKLDKLKAERNMKNAEFARLCDIPYTTLDGFYKKGFENAKVSTLRKIAKACSVTLDYLVIDEAVEEYSYTEKTLVKAWRFADDEKRGIVAYTLGFNYAPSAFEKEA